jgi:hypothetical protein
MKKYGTQGLSASGTATKTAVTIISSASIRPLVAEFSIGVRTNPNASDQQVNFRAGSWATSAGTAGSSPTPKPLDLVDPVAAVSTAGITHSGEPTYDSTDFFNSDLNQRGFFRWVAEIGFELGITAAATKGFGIQMVAVTAAVQISAPAHHKEKMERQAGHLALVCQDGGEGVRRKDRKALSRLQGDLSSLLE